MKRVEIKRKGKCDLEIALVTALGLITMDDRRADIPKVLEIRKNQLKERGWPHDDELIRGITMRALAEFLANPWPYVETSGFEPAFDNALLILNFFPEAVKKDTVAIMILTDPSDPERMLGVLPFKSKNDYQEKIQTVIQVMADA
jgi:hypothetical protein